MTSKNIISLSNLYDASVIGVSLCNPALSATMGIGKILFQQLSLSTGILQKNTESLKCKFDSLTETEKNDLAMMAYNMHMQAINGLSEENLDLLSKLIANQIRKDDIDISKDKYNKFSKVVSALDKEEIIVVSEVIEAYKELCSEFVRYYDIKYKQSSFFNLLVVDHYLTKIKNAESKKVVSEKLEVIEGMTRTALFRHYSSQFHPGMTKNFSSLSVTSFFNEFVKYIDENPISDANS